MCFLFLSLISCSKIERGFCSANIDGYFFDFSSAKDLAPFQIDDNEGYYVLGKVCGDIQASDFPPNFPFQYGVSALRCLKNDTSNCDIIGYTDTQNYMFLEPQDPNSGVMASQIAQNFDVDKGFNMYQISYPIGCSESSSFDPNSCYIFDLNAVKMIAVEFGNKFGCPKKDVKPTPSPEPFLNINCSTVDYSEVVYPYKINMNLSNFELARPYGVPIAINSSAYALINPCNVGNCPPNKDCGDDKNASIWLCTDNKKCKSYGNAQEQFKFAVRNDEHSDEGFVLSYETSKITITCAFDIFSDKDASNIVRVDKFEIDENNHAKIAASSIDACMKPVKPPPPSSCSAKFGEKLIDLTVLNTLGGYFQPIELKEVPGYDHYVYVQPCGGLNCPSYDCDEANGASIWECRDDKKHITCDCYGSFYEEISIDVAQNYSPRNYSHKNITQYGNGIEAGIVINYKSLESGKMPLTSRLELRCDWQIGLWDMRIDSAANLFDYSQLRLTGAARHVCVGDKPWFPPQPSPTVMPTPEPNPTTEFVREDPADPRSYVSFNLINMFDGVSSVVNFLTLNSKVNMTFQYTPFNPQECPKGNICDFAEESDGWGCWFEHCYPIATHNYSIKTVQTESINTSTYTIPGYDRFSLEFTIRCNPSQTTIRLLDDKTTYDEASGKFSIASEASFACPKTHSPTSQPTSHVPTDTTTITSTATTTITATDDPDAPDVRYGSTTGGAVFVTAVSVGIIFYFAIGTLLNFAKFGVIEIPNYPFWHEFGECVLTALRYILVCECTSREDPNQIRSDVDNYTSHLVAADM